MTTCYRLALAEVNPAEAFFYGDSIYAYLHRAALRVRLYRHMIYYPRVVQLHELPPSWIPSKQRFRDDGTRTTLGGQPIESSPMLDTYPRLLAAIMQGNPTANHSRIAPHEKALLERIRQHIRIKRPRAYDMGAYRLIDATNIQILII